QDTPFFAHPFTQARFFLLLPDPRRFPLSFPAALLLETENSARRAAQICLESS
ncbi:MAG: hypothetical protein RIS76_1899, partial [Verrucomicrobiota bacterium]